MTAANLTASLGDLLRRYKSYERITSLELAERLNVSKGTADRLLQDRLPDLSLPLAECIASLMGMELADVSVAYRVSAEVMKRTAAAEAS